MTFGTIEAIQRERDYYFTERLPVCAACREPIEDDVYYIIERRHYCPECALKWLRKQAHKNERA